MNDSNWAAQRKMIIYGLLIMIGLLFGLYVYNSYRESQKPAPSCHDNIMNQDEGGIDCEGICQKICKEHMTPIKVLYNKAIKLATSTYDIVSLIENRNVAKSPGEINYVIHAYNGENEIYQYSGKRYILDGAKIPFVLNNIKVNSDKDIERVDLELQYTDLYPVPAYHEVLEVKDYAFNNDNQDLNFKLVNSSLYDRDNVRIIAIVYNKYEAIAAGSTMIDTIARKSEVKSKIIWNEPLELDTGNRIEFYIENVTHR